METLRLFATLLPLAVGSGINLYATVLTAGLAIQFNWVTGTPPGLDVLGSWPVIIIAGILFMVEMLADKIPYLDNIWDVVHTFIRPLGASLLGFAALGTADPAVMIIAAMFAGSLALVSHGGKAGSRVAMNIVSPMENVSNLVVSTAEDIGVGVLTLIALKYPYVALGIAIVILLLIVLFVPMMLRWAWFMLSGFFVWIKSLFDKLFNNEVLPDPLPADHQLILLPGKPEISIRCKAQHIPGANGRTGYLSMADGKIFFTFENFTKIKLWQIPITEISTHSIKKNWLMDVLFLQIINAKGKSQRATFVILKDKAPLLNMITQQLRIDTAVQ